MSETFDRVVLLARDLHIPLPEILGMPPALFMKLQGHYMRHPQGDYRTHYLIAKLICAVENMFLPEGEKPRTIYDQASWLDTPEVQKARQKWEADEELRIAREGARAALRNDNAD